MLTLGSPGFPLLAGFLFYRLFTTLDDCRGWRGLTFGVTLLLFNEHKCMRIPDYRRRGTIYMQSSCVYLTTWLNREQPKAFLVSPEDLR